MTTIGQSLLDLLRLGITLKDACERIGFPRENVRPWSASLDTDFWGQWNSLRRSTEYKLKRAEFYGMQRLCKQCGCEILHPRSFCDTCRDIRVKDGWRRKANRSIARHAGWRDKTCKRCGKPFTAKNMQQLYCTSCQPFVAREKAFIAERARRAERWSKLPPRICPSCQRTFKPPFGPGNKKFCSDQCRDGLSWAKYLEQRVPPASGYQTYFRIMPDALPHRVRIGKSRVMASRDKQYFTHNTHDMFTLAIAEGDLESEIKNIFGHLKSKTKLNENRKRNEVYDLTPELTEYILRTANVDKAVLALVEAKTKKYKAIRPDYASGPELPFDTAEAKHVS